MTDATFIYSQTGQQEVSTVFSGMANTKAVLLGCRLLPEHRPVDDPRQMVRDIDMRRIAQMGDSR
jgi:predicted ATP-dependent serine protease